MKTAGPFDYVIVGGGTAGCLLANRLSADPRNTVLLLEAGGKDDWIWIHIPVGYLYCIGNPRTDWCYRTEPDPGLNGRSILYARGRVLGGSSSINAMLYLRGQARDYDEWARLTGDSGWAWRNVLPVFRKSEDHWRGADEFHGGRTLDASGGHEWRVERQRLSWEILDAFRDAAVEAGIAKVEDFNRGDNSGSSRFEVNQRRGVRVNASKAFLRPAQGRPNLSVVTGAQVKKLRLEGRRVLGVEYRAGRRERVRRGARETLLAAGAIGSPQILQLSGIGPGALLQRHGIAVVHDLPGGREPAGPPAAAHGVSRAERAHAQHHGQFLVGQGEDGARIRAAPHRAPDHGAVAAGRVREEAIRRSRHPISSFTCSRCRWTSSAIRCTRFPAFTASVCNLRPASRGHVRIKSPDPHAHPAIMLNYLSTPQDRAIAVQALRLTRRIVLGTRTMQKYAPEEFLPGPAFTTDERTGAGRGQYRHHHLSSGGHLQDGARRRRGCGGRSAIARARHRTAARDRRLDHARDYLRQHQFADADDRRARRDAGPGQRRLGKRFGMRECLPA